MVKRLALLVMSFGLLLSHQTLTARGGHRGHHGGGGHHHGGGGRHGHHGGGGSGRHGVRGNRAMLGVATGVALGAAASSGSHDDYDPYIDSYEDL